MEEEGEDKEQERLVAMVSHCLCPINRSITIVFTTSSLYALFGELCHVSVCVHSSMQQTVC